MKSQAYYSDIQRGDLVSVEVSIIPKLTYRSVVRSSTQQGIYIFNQHGGQWIRPHNESIQVKLVKRFGKMQFTNLYKLMREHT